MSISLVARSKRMEAMAKLAVGGDLGEHVRACRQRDVLALHEQPDDDEAEPHREIHALRAVADGKGAQPHVADRRRWTKRLARISSPPLPPKPALARVHDFADARQRRRESRTSPSTTTGFCDFQLEAIAMLVRVGRDGLEQTQMDFGFGGQHARRPAADAAASCACTAAQAASISREPVHHADWIVDHRQAPRFAVVRCCSRSAAASRAAHSRERARGTSSEGMRGSPSVAASPGKIVSAAPEFAYPRRVGDTRQRAATESVATL